MQRIWVLDIEADQEQIAALSTSHTLKSLSLEPIMIGTHASTWVRITASWFREIPEITGYVPFNVIYSVEIYSPEQEVLDLAILSAYTKLPVTSTTKTSLPSGIEVSYFMEGGEPLWIAPSRWNQWSKLLTPGLGKQLFSTNPLTAVIIAMREAEATPLPVTKHPVVDVWFADADTDLSSLDLTALNRKLEPVFRLIPPQDPQDYQILKEILRAYDFKQYKLATLNQDKYLYLISPPSFRGNELTPEWLANLAYPEARKGHIPVWNANLGSVSAIRAAIRAHKWITAYLDSLDQWDQKSGLVALGNLFADIDARTLSLSLDSAASLQRLVEQVAQKSKIGVETFDSIESALDYRYQLSLAGSRSLLHAGSQFIVTYVIKQDPIPVVPSSSAVSLVEGLRQSLNSESIFNTVMLGYLSWGVLLGIRDSIAFRDPVVPTEGMVIIEPQGRVVIEMISGFRLPILDSSSPDPKLKAQITAAWDSGQLLSDWARAYTRTQGLTSVAPVVTF